MFLVLFCLRSFHDADTWLTHWGWVTHICVGNLTIIGSDNGLSPGRRQAITWTNVGILLIGPLGTNFNEMLIQIHAFSFKKIHLKMLSGKWRPFCLGLNVLTCEWENLLAAMLVTLGQGHAVTKPLTLPVDKMATISQMTFSSAFSWMKSLVFWFKFHWSLFLRL